MTGNETVVDLYLYENNLETKNLSIKEENLIKTESAPYEHDYYTSETEFPNEKKIKIEDSVQLDHTYSLLHSYDITVDTNLIYGVNQEQEEPRTAEEIVCDFKSDLVINGNSVFKNSTIKQLTAKLLSKDTHVKVLKIMGKDGKTLIITKNDTGMQSTVIDYHKYKINIPIEKFKCVLEILPFLFRRLPLITNLADSLSYKSRYPYVAKDLNEYLSWNIGRRLSSEVSIVIKSVIQISYSFITILVETSQNRFRISTNSKDPRI